MELGLLPLRDGKDMYARGNVSGYKSWQKAIEAGKGS